MSDDVKVGPVRDADTGEIKRGASETGSGDGSNEMGAENFDGDNVKSYDDENDGEEDKDNFSDKLTDPDYKKKAKEKGKEVKEKAESVKEKADNVKKRAEKAKDNSAKKVDSLRQFLGLDKLDNKDYRDAVEKKDIQDSDLRDKDSVTGFESPAEVQMQMYKDKDVTGVDSKKEANQVIRVSNFEDAEKNKDDAEEKVSDIEKSIDRIKNDGSSEYTLDNGEVVSDKQLIERLQNNKSDLENDISKISKNQNKRLDNIVKSGRQIQKMENTVSAEKAEQIARNNDLSDKSRSVTFYGVDTGIDVSGPLADAGQIFQAALSGKSGELAAASVDQFVGSSKNDQTVEDVAEEQAIKEAEQVSEGERGVVDEVVSTSTSLPGLAVTGAAGGAAFSGVSKAASQLPRFGGFAQKAVQAGGVYLGAKTVAKQGSKAKKEFDKGDETEGLETILDTGAGFYGFYKGSKAAGRYLSSRTGSTEVSQKNVLKKVNRNDLVGKGAFKSKTNVINKKIRSPVGFNGYKPSFRLPVKRSVEQVKASAKDYAVRGSESTAEAQGNAKIQMPSGRTRDQRFEALSINFNVLSKLSDTRISRDILRTEEVGKLFKKTKESQEFSKSIKEGSSSQSRLNTVSDFISKSEKIDGKIVDVGSVNSKSSTFSDAKNFIFNSKSVSGSGSGGVSGSGRGGSALKYGFQETRFPVEKVSQRAASRYADRQSPSFSVSNTGFDTSVSGSGNSGGQQMESMQGSMPEIQEVSKNSQNTDFKQVNYVSGSQESSGSGRTGLQRDNEVASTASEIVKKEKNDFISNGSDFVERNDSKNRSKTGKSLVSGSSQDVGNRNILDSDQFQNQRGFEKVGPGLNQVGKTFQGSVSRNNLDFSSLPIEKLNSETNNLQDNDLVNVRKVPGIVQKSFSGSGVLPGISFKRKKRSMFSRSGSSVRSNDYDRVPKDWFSANLVEQKTGREATFETGKIPSNRFFGLKTVQESSGQVKQDKILEYNNGGFDNGRSQYF